MSTQFDPDGWQYATTLDSPFWHPQNNNALCKFHYRRRTWHRKLQRLPRGSKSAATPTATGGATSSSN